MKNPLLILGLTIAVFGCSRGEAVGTADGAKPPEAVAATSATAAAERAPASTPAPAGPSAPTALKAEPAGPEYREVTIPAGTALPLTLRTAVSSATSDVEDRVSATVRRAVSINGVEAIPEGATVIGHVTDAARSAKVKGRARVAFRFTRLDMPGEGGQMNIRTGTIARVAAPTKKRDAATIGGGAVGGAIVGGILGGGDGAAKGAVIGGAGGTGVVLATRGKEVSIAAGAPISVKLTQPLTVRVRLR